MVGTGRTNESCSFFQVALSGERYYKMLESSTESFIKKHFRRTWAFQSAGNYSTMEDIKQPLTGHLTDLRRCLVISFVAVGICFIIAYAFVDNIGYWFFKPLFDVLPQGTSLIFTSYQDAFFLYLKLALVSAVFLSSPVILWEIWSFVAPGLYQHEKRMILPFTFVSTLCFIGGASFGYFIAFSPAFRFLIGYTTEYLTPMPAANEYFSLAVRLLIAFGVIFELPVVMVFLARAGLVDVGFLIKNRKYWILIAFVIAALVTPTSDVVNQLLMAAPLVLLYEISIVAVWVLGKKKRPERFI